jgi:glycosyltransferase involved in cell wall biosynthesis
MLLDYFLRYLLTRDGDLTLVLAGPGETRMPVRLTERIVRLGAVDERTKRDALAGALLTVQPSVRESFSLVLMESWAQGTPVLVNAGCDVTRHFALESGGGVPFANFAEFAGLVDYVRAHPDVRAALGARGQAYVRDRFDWSRILLRYAALAGGEAVAGLPAPA